MRFSFHAHKQFPSTNNTRKTHGQIIVQNVDQDNAVEEEEKEDITLLRF